MVEWTISKEPVDYETAIRQMDSRVAGIHAGVCEEQIWLLEHPSLYTAGTSAKAQDLLNPQFPVYKAGRGGQYTYHGAGQRIAYLMLDLKKRQNTPDIKKYVHDLEAWIIQTLALFDIHGERRTGRIGIWVDTPTGEKKIAALGVRVRHWITLHGVSINLDPDLSHFNEIVPCGLSQYGVTSMREILGRDIPMAELDQALRTQAVDYFS